MIETSDEMIEDVDRGDIATAVGDVEGEFQEEDPSLPGLPPVQILGQTSSVWIYSVSCATGASTSFALPITAWGWCTRLGYYRADGGRIGLSSIYEWNRSFYAGSRPSAGGRRGRRATHRGARCSIP